MVVMVVVLVIVEVVAVVVKVGRRGSGFGCHVSSGSGFGSG